MAVNLELTSVIVTHTRKKGVDSPKDTGHNDTSYTCSHYASMAGCNTRAVCKPNKCVTRVGPTFSRLAKPVNLVQKKFTLTCLLCIGGARPPEYR